MGLTEFERFDSVRITLASPESIRSWSRGEVKNPETINYRTYKPERGGLFCERIFGPTRDWECSCGKYKRIKHKGVICDRCGVEVTVSRVRRERMGHIELAVPVCHIWFFKCTPSRIGLMLDMTSTALERVLYYEDYLVVNPGETSLQDKQLLTEIEYREALEKFGDGFQAKMGAEAIRDALTRIDLDSMMGELEDQMEKTKSKQTRKKISKRMKIVEGFRTSQTRPEWMILDVLPVIPPELRPLVPLEGGRFATSDLNDLYRRVINRNNRLRNLQQLKTPDVIIRNEKRMLQEAVDAVFDNGRHGRPVTGAGNRPLKSLSDMLRGKGGRFRQNLLGKRVDYSGRSVIVIGPELKLHQCGLPKKMALVLFEPFIIRRLKEMGVVHTVRSAKKLIERQSDEVWDILEEVTRGKTVMLNRAPTLHRLSIQSFEPILVEGDAIQIHPLVCTAFNADFDGDQMAVHVPLSVEAQMESRLLMMSTNSIFSPSSGRSIMTPTQDITLGIYYLTSDSQKFRMNQFVKTARPEMEHLPILSDVNDVRLGVEEGVLKLHNRIRFRNPDLDRDTIFGDKQAKLLSTTVGRVFFNEIWPASMGFVNRLVDKGFLGQLIWNCHKLAGQECTVRVLDDLKKLGFENATLAGVSIGMGDLVIPREKQMVLDDAFRQVGEVEQQYKQGVITDGERYNKIVDIWTHATEEIANVMYRAIEENAGSNEINPVFMMVDSKARGSRQQIRQLAGMRGLMAKPSGEIIERPILSNFREGLSVLEYFISTHGARKGLADTALKTADAGYLTRKLVDVSQDVIIVEQDCNTVNGIEVAAITEGDEELVSLKTRLVGRTVLNDLTDPRTGALLVRAGMEVDEEACKRLEEAGIESVRIRSVLTCESRDGICAKCYGWDLSRGKTVDVGTAVGIIAAQSIGEPGTQLTMRTFHIGGTASSVFKQPEVMVKNAGIVKYHDLRVVQNKEGKTVVLNKNGSISLHDESGHEMERYIMAIGAIVHVPDGGRISKGACLAEWDPYSVPVLAEQEGIVSFHDFVENVSVKKEVDEATGLRGTVVLETKEDLHPQIIVKDPSGQQIHAFYSIPAGAHVMVREGRKVLPGELLAKLPRKESKTRDITGGLPRVAELFEARQPKDAAEIAKIEGVVDFGANQRGKRCLVIRDEVTGAMEEHLITMGKHIVVFKGDRVRKGQQLTEGPIVPQEILEVCGPQALQEYLVNEVQEVYRLQGVEINDKHIEIIVRQMLRKVRITNPGDTEFLWGEQVMKQKFLEVNDAAMAEGKRPAEATPALLGITKSSLETDSFISAASFQDTTRVLTDAATLGRVDVLRGFKENVIMGQLIPGGTGFPLYRNIKLVPLAEPVPEEDMAATNEATKKLQDLLG
ncbi:MAG: DNA-directed RNA polymerase subunit beta' [Lentisphaerae bacterium RIFOXYC12_FULL_60_16]|nr:MAG: DNA-directed RNA polymerase subunit beta' [Lentisphaerae bacterium RIFOXYC12_FULL_60_16]OGV71152.1 MAG: DNA-directed RNA polymerase subunit beta' [Lentisphaerae bacterium RIFOXYA12_FULL_60_10]OGV77328.1 MAG: DNA-directed RNA polymerase subunit beta' [Lentisphaerae bacterium RIFOXYB12_FULL_60_10]